MNITELARKLRISPQELRDSLPELGFDIGQRAIKIDNRTAQRIMDNWPRLRRRLEQKRAEEEEKRKKEMIKMNPEELKEVRIPAMLTVKKFADIIEMPVTQVMSELMKNGVLSTLNDRIDFETAAIIAEDLGFKVIEEKEDYSKKEVDSAEELRELLAEKDKNKLLPRPPVVVIMGHVDHGKTKLLDYIRKANVIDTEAGGITQHIGAYQVEKKGQIITFIDTPGHEAFTAIRSRGARIADIAVLIVAADDGMKTQSLEALKIIQAAGLSFVVAINKIDKPEANIEKVKQELAQHNLLPEDWGGKTICVPISAKSGEGIDNLLEMILLVADLEKEKIMANPNKRAVGTVIESHVDKGEGSVATVLIQSGTLKINDNLSVDGTFYGKVRAMKNFRGESIPKAVPGMPVKISGFKVAPYVGDILVIPLGTKFLKKKIKAGSSEDKMISLKSKKQETKDDEGKVEKFNIILKADVLGSLEAVLESLEKIFHPEVKVEIVAKGLGNITETDILKAEATGAMIIGFNVLANTATENLAQDKKVEIKFYKIIYELIKEIKDRLEKLLSPEVIQENLGKMQILAIFRREKDSMIVGGKVTAGEIKLEPNNSTQIIVWRNKEKITTGELIQLNAGKEEVRSVEEGQEAGIKFKGEPIIEKEDVLEFYRTKRQSRKL